MNKKSKKIIAREVIVLFSSIILALMFVTCLSIYNSYHRKHIKILEHNISELDNERAILPEDNIGYLYSQIKESFIIYYEVDGSVYRIPVNLTDDFLLDFPEAKKLTPNLLKHEISKENIDYDYVDFKEFRELINDSIYRENLYGFVKQEHDFGTKNEFEAMINEGLQYNDSVEMKKHGISNEIRTHESEILLRTNKLKEEDEMTHLVLMVSLFILFIV